VIVLFYPQRVNNGFILFRRDTTFALLMAKYARE